MSNYLRPQAGGRTTNRDALGFVGLGTMGLPMATNLLKAGATLTIWNRTLSRCRPLAARGATVAPSSDQLFERCRTVLMMLWDEHAIDEVLHRHSPEFRDTVTEHTIVNMSTVPPEYSKGLARDIVQAGGRFVEAPVSGSRVPAELGQLVAMTATADSVAHSAVEISSLLAPMCAGVIDCGSVPNALLTKLAVNLYMISSVLSLTESVHFAQRVGIDPGTLLKVLESGPMDSALLRVKGRKLVDRNFDAQASVIDAAKNVHLILEYAARSAVATPHMSLAAGLLDGTKSLGHGDRDMVAVLIAQETWPDAPASPRG